MPHEQIRSPLFTPDARLDAWFAGTGIETAERGGRVYYLPAVRDELVRRFREQEAEA